MITITNYQKQQENLSINSVVSKTLTAAEIQAQLQMLDSELDDFMKIDFQKLTQTKIDEKRVRLTNLNNIVLENQNYFDNPQLVFRKLHEIEDNITRSKGVKINNYIHKQSGSSLLSNDTTNSNYKCFCFSFSPEFLRKRFQNFTKFRG